MPGVVTRDQILLMGGTPPPIGEDVLPPQTTVKKLKRKSGSYRRQEVVEEKTKEKLRDLLYNIYQEWNENTAILRNKLLRANALMEGIKDPKDFPWENSSNLHVPVIEIHITILHSVVSSTMLDNDPIWYVKIAQNGVPENVDNEIETFLSSVSKLELKIDAVLSDIYWAAYRDGTAIGDLDWVEEYSTQYDVLKFTDPLMFEEAFPTPISAGITSQKYNELAKELLEQGELTIKVEEYVSTYRGPRLRQVELKDFVMVPTTSPDVKYAQFVGDMFIQRADYFKRLVKQDGWFDKIEVQTMLKKTGLTSAPDTGTRSQDQIEGVSRTRKTKPDEYWCMQGILNVCLPGLLDSETMEVENRYLVVFHPESKAILRFECYPYLHNRIKYIPWRFKKRPNRFLGQSIYDQLGDVNEEIDTQHNQRIDSRTISTVPSFLKVDNFEFDPTRKNQRFYPGVTFKVSNLNQIKQFEIKQTDLGQSLQEEQNLMYLAELRTGASSLRSGREASRDPRAPAKKIQLQLAQSDIRVDDHMRELRIGTAEVGTQILELYYQHAPDMIAYYTKNPETAQFIQKQIVRQKLRARDLFLEVARTSVNDNPDQLFQRELTLYQLLSNEPLIGSNMIRRRELIVRVLTAMRQRNIYKIIPTVQQLLEELGQQEQMLSPLSPQTHQMLGMNLAGMEGKQQKSEGGIAPKRALDTSNSTKQVQS